MLPLLIIATFAAIDVAQYVNACQVMANVSRDGARIATRSTTTSTSDCSSAMLAYLDNEMTHMTSTELAQCVTIEFYEMVTDPDTGTTSPSKITGTQLNSVPSGAMIQVDVSINFDDIRWLGGPFYGNPSTTTYCRRE